MSETFDTVLTASSGTVITQAQWSDQIADNLNWNVVTPIAEIHLEGSTSSLIEFSGLSIGNDFSDAGSSYANFMLFYRAQSTDTAGSNAVDGVRVVIGPDGTTLTDIGLFGWSINDGSGVTRQENLDGLVILEIPNAAAQANQYGVGVLHIPGQYTNIEGADVLNRGISCIGGITRNSDTADNNTSTFIGGGQFTRGLGSGLPSDARITLACVNGSFAEGSLFTLYGWGTT